MQLIRRLVLFNVAVAVAVLITPRAFAQYYTATDLGTFGGGSSDAGALAINSSGEVVGQILTPGGTFHAFSYNGGTMIDLGTLGGTTSVAEGVNDSGLIVGYSTTSTGAIHAFSYSGGVMTDLGAPTGGYSLAYDVNNSGLIVGVDSRQGTPNDSHAFSEIGGVVTDLGAPTGGTSVAEGINNSGEIVGSFAAFRGPSTAFSDIGGVMTSLGVPYIATDVNNSGAIGGFNAHAFSDVGGVVTDLGVLGGDNSAAFAINDSGVIVGDSTITEDLPEVAIIDVGGVMTNLDSLTNFVGSDLVGLEQARDVNDQGQIVGFGVNESGDGVAFLLTPTSIAPPVPDISNSALLLIVGIAGIAIASRAQKIG